jgi:kexin
MIILWTLLSSFLLHSIGATPPTKPSYGTHNYYVLAHNSQLDSSSGASLADVTAALGVELVEQVGELQDHWLVRQSIPEGDVFARDGIDQVFKALEMLKAQAQAQAQAPHAPRSDDSYLALRVVSSIYYLSLQYLRLRVKRAPPHSITQNVSASRAMAERFGFTDPKFPEQWHIVNDDYPEHMMNVSGVWEMGFKGQGIISSLVDDGLDYESEDLSANFVRTLLFYFFHKTLFVLGCGRLV